MIILLYLTAACTQFPELDATLDQATLDAPYPDLVPLGPLLAQADGIAQTGQTSATAQASFDSRLVRLRAQAARLRGPVVDRATRARMARGIAIAALQ